MGYMPGNNRRHDPKNAVDSTISPRWHGDNRRSDDYEFADNDVNRIFES